MKSVTATWTDKSGQTHEVGFYHHASGQDRNDHVTVGSVVIVDPVNKRKKEPHRGQVFMIKSFRFWHSVARAILVPVPLSGDCLGTDQKTAAEIEVTAEIGDLRLASDQEIKVAETIRANAPQYSNFIEDGVVPPCSWCGEQHSELDCFKNPGRAGARSAPSSYFPPPPSIRYQRADTECADCGGILDDPEEGQYCEKCLRRHDLD